MAQAFIEHSNIAQSEHDGFTIEKRARNTPIYPRRKYLRINNKPAFLLLNRWTKEVSAKSNKPRFSPRFICIVVTDVLIISLSAPG